MAQTRGRGRPARQGLGSDRITAALEELQKADTALRSAVMDARQLGDTWTVIGAALGITRQAARKRYGEQTPDSAKERQRGSYS